MTKRLLIDASHAEETRVVVLDGNRLEDFDVETQSRRQLKGNIYLAKVVRVEPSLQAAFVEYGGNRHGFLAFGEIHPDYYQIPVADRQRLLAMQEEEARAEEEADEDESAYVPAPAAETYVEFIAEEVSADAQAQPLARQDDVLSGPAVQPVQAWPEPAAEPIELGADTAPEAAEPAQDVPAAEIAAIQADEAAGQASDNPAMAEIAEQPDTGHRVQQVQAADAPAPETIGGESDPQEEIRPARQPSRFMRSYKIQEVIRRRQILLVQVVKEERGTKGAALTTYISLAGRYCVLMPNSPRGGGISRKITSAADRRRLKEVTTELEIPRGMGLIVRTAGAARPKAEIKRDGEYLLRLWDDIREQTMQSTAPALIYEEASLIKRAIRDVYSRDVDELLVDGEEGWRAARDYMRMLMPTHVKKVQLWPQNAQPLFAHQQVESMLDAMLSPTVQLRSGGYLVINQTEALVAIDVNSGRSTRERGIEETALRTNMEAAEEAARQLRLRDLAGLIVIDFIDMESKKHNAMVERRMADALKNDRARIQIGHISHFGLLELSRQRLRPSLAETSLNVCQHCGGTGHVRSTESAALHVLREIEEEGGRRRAAEILVHVNSATALYILNHKRQRLTEIEQRYGMVVCFAPDETLLAAQTRIDRLRAALPSDLPPPVVQAQQTPEEDAGEADISEEEDDVDMPAAGTPPSASSAAPAADFTTDADHVPGETAEEGERRRKRRRRRRRGGRREEGAATETAAPALISADQPEIPDLPIPTNPEDAPPVPGHDEASEAADEVPALHATIDQNLAQIAEPGEAPAKRGRRGGRRRRKPGEEGLPPATPAAATPYAPPAYVPYVGPTPADPFALSGLDIFEALEQAELNPPPQGRPEAAPPRLEAFSDVQADEPTVPVIRPVLIGSGEATVVERKKGWWRR
jgi:ribonuclease E